MTRTPSPCSRTPSTGGRELLDAVVIGAGQAGLALGSHLARRGADFLLVDAAPESWEAYADPANKGELLFAEPSSSPARMARTTPLP